MIRLNAFRHYRLTAIYYNTHNNIIMIAQQKSFNYTQLPITIADLNVISRLVWLLGSSNEFTFSHHKLIIYRYSYLLLLLFLLGRSCSKSLNTSSFQITMRWMEKVACWSTKATIPLKHVQIEKKLLWGAYRNSPSLFRTVPSRPPTASPSPKLVFAPHPKLQSLLSQQERVKLRTSN